MDLRASGGESPVNVGGEGAVPGVIYKENSLSSINTPPSLPRADSAVSMTKERSVSMSDVKVPGSRTSWGYEHELTEGGTNHKRTLSSEKLTSKFIKPPFIKKQDAPISRELSDRARSAPLVKKFALPPTETLINDYSAALLKHILIHGRMYVSQNYICFESKIFGIKTMEVIPFKDITVLTKKSKKLKFAHGIEVATSSQIYYFASFVSRVRAFETLTKIWREHVPKDPQNPDDDDDDDDDDDGTQDYESDDSSLKKKDKRTAKEHPEGLKLGRSVESQPGELIEERERGLRRFSSPLLSRVLPKHNSSSSTASTTSLDQGEQGQSPSNSQSPSQSNSQTQLPTSSGPVNIPSNSNNNTSSTVSNETPVPSPHESEDEDDTNYDSGDGFLGSEATYQPVLTATFPINVKTFFKLFVSDDSTFTKTYHDSRGDKDLTIKKWANSPQFGWIRDVNFLSPVKVPLGPSQTRLTENQRYHLTKNRLVIDTVSMMLDIPYGDCFRVEGKWDVTAPTPETCKLVINIGVHFMKKTWFKGKIESQTIKETRESYQQWAALAPTEISKYKASQNNAPSQPNSAAPSPMLPVRNPLASSSNPSSSSTSSLSSSVSSTSSPPPSSIETPPPVSLEPSVPLEGPRRASYAGEGGKLARVTNMLSSLSSPLSNSLQGQSIASVVWFLVFGFVFMHMYLRIAHLEGQVATLETILQPLLAKELKDL